jgi:hypothetical protein
MVEGTAEEQHLTDEAENLNLVPTVRNVSVETSPHLAVQYQDLNVSILLDYSAEANLASYETIQNLNIPIYKTNQGARQADGSTPLQFAGEAHIPFTFKHHTLLFNCLVVRELPVSFLGGVFIPLWKRHLRPPQDEHCVRR